MGKKNNYSVVTVITGMTLSQATRMSAAIVKNKESIAPNSRGTSAFGESTMVGSLLSAGHRDYLGGGKKNG